MERKIIRLDDIPPDFLISEEDSDKPKGPCPAAHFFRKIYKVVPLLVLFLWGAFFMSGCGKDDAEMKSGISSILDLNSPKYTIGGMTGITATLEAKKKLPNATFAEYPMPADALTPLVARKISAVVLDRPTLEYMSMMHPELAVIQEDLAIGQISVAADLKDTELMAKVNEFIRSYRADGTYQEMFDRWFHTVNAEIPEFEQPVQIKGTLKVGITDGNVPMSFVKDGKPAGFDSEFALRLGAFLENKVEFVDLPYEAMIAALNSGKIDLAIAQMDATEERAQKVLFSEYYIDSPITMIIHRDDYAPAARTENGKISCIKDLNNPGFTIGSQTDILAIRESKRLLPHAKYLEYATAPDSYLALSSGKIDAVVYDRPALEYAILSHPELMVLQEDLTVGHICVGAKLGQDKLIAKVNEFIAKIRADGTYEEMFDRWVRSKNPVMPDIPVPENPDGTLRVGVDTDNVPMSFIQDEKHAGYDIEFSRRLAYFMNKKVQFCVYPYESQVAALVSDKIDLSIDQLDNTPERSETVLFSKEYIDSPIAMMIRKEDFSVPQNTESVSGKISKLMDLDSPKYTIASQTDILAIRESKRLLPHAKYLEYATAPDSYLALSSGKIDAVVYDRPALEYAILSHPELMVLQEDLTVGHICVGAKLGQDKLIAKVNEFITKIRADGTYEEMFDRWVRSKNPVMPDIPVPENPEGTLRVGVDTDNVPMSFIQDEKHAGYDIEFSRRLAYFMNKKVQFCVYPYESQVAALVSDKIDLSIDQLDNTPERSETVLFSKEYIDSPIAMMIRKKDYGGDGAEAYVEEDVGFIAWCRDTCKSLASSFDKTFLRERRWNMLLVGLWRTFYITVLSVLFGTLLAFPICMMCRSHCKFSAWLGARYVSIIQGTPILVLLMILYYVVFARVEIGAPAVAIIAFAIDFAAYTSVSLRAGIDSIPRGQTEAALALGFKPSTAFFRFVLPQAVRINLPVYRGEVISTLKSTSIVGYISIMDLTKMGDIIRSRTYEAFFPLIAIAVLYFILAKLVTAALLVLEKKLNPEYHRNELLRKLTK